MEQIGGQGKEEKTGTGKRASKTRHGGTGGERRAAPTGHPKVGVPRAARADGARGNVGCAGMPRAVPRRRCREPIPGPHSFAGEGKPRDDLLRPDDQHRRGRGSGEQGNSKRPARPGARGGVAEQSRLHANGGRAGVGCGGQGATAKMEAGGLGWGWGWPVWLSEGPVEELATRPEKKERQTGRKTEGDMRRAGVEWRTYLIRSMPRLWRS